MSRHTYYRPSLADMKQGREDYIAEMMAYQDYTREEAESDADDPINRDVIAECAMHAMCSRRGFNAADFEVVSC